MAHSSSGAGETKGAEERGRRGADRRVAAAVTVENERRQGERRIGRDRRNHPRD